MSVLIKGMEMPSCCYDCNFCRHYDEPNQGYYCVALCSDLHRENITEKRSKGCPLVELPPHEDLIGRNALKKSLHEAFDDADAHAFELGAYWHHSIVVGVINNAPTIIKAEEK